MTWFGRELVERVEHGARHAGLELERIEAVAPEPALVVDRGAKKLTATPAYYVLRHLSQFVAPKATVIARAGGCAGVRESGR